MNHTLTRAKLNSQGDIHIPPKLIREMGFRPEEEVTLIFNYGRIVIEKPHCFTSVDELLKSLEAQGTIELCHFDEFPAGEEVSRVMLKQLDRILEGVTIPVEKYLREERAKVDDPFCA
ncbi:MAG: hypothetical protein U9R15_08390 [Chloroflexota bacterium]|nr:hypothetical protein [Chloroflexota bacterium]